MSLSRLGAALTSAAVVLVGGGVAAVAATAPSPATTSDRAATSTVGPDVSGPAAVGLCTAWSHVRESQGKAAERSPAFRAVQEQGCDVTLPGRKAGDGTDDRAVPRTKAEKDAAKAQRKHDHAAAKAQRKHDHAAAKAQRKHDHAAAKAQRKHDRDQAGQPPRGRR